MKLFQMFTGLQAALFGPTLADGDHLEVILDQFLMSEDSSSEEGWSGMIQKQRKNVGNVANNLAN